MRIGNLDGLFDNDRSFSHMTAQSPPRAEALPEAMTVVAKSLAEHYGVPGDSVTAPRAAMLSAPGAMLFLSGVGNVLKMRCQPS